MRSNSVFLLLESWAMLRLDSKLRVTLASSGRCLWILLCAEAAGRVDPVSLDEIVASSQSHIVFRAVRGRELRAEGPRALIGILGASGVIPRVQVWIRGRLFQ